MKSYFLKSVFLAAVSLLLYSCDQNDDVSLDQNLKIFMDFKSKNLATEIGGVNNFMSVISASQFNSKELKLAGFNAEEGYMDGTCTECDSTQNWSYFTCAIVSESKNADGSTTTIYDYGTGCDEYGSIMKGKITYIWKNDGNNYESKVIYDHYFCAGIEMNGYSENTFTSDGNSYFEYSNPGAGLVDSTSNTSDSISYPEISFNWSGTSTSKEDITITENDGVEYKYTSEYATKWDNTSYTVLTGFYKYSSKSENYEYSYIVSKPLVTNYECSLSWVPVSGIETTTSIKSGKKDILEINYGDGTCDNFALVTENGKTTTVDMSKWYTVSSDGVTTNSKSIKVKIKRK